MARPIFDNHVHLSPEGRNVEAVREFVSAGGTHFNLTYLPWGQPRTTEEFAASYQRTLALAERVRRETPAQVFCVVGPYPVHLVELAERLPLSQALGAMEAGLEEAIRLYETQEVVAIGEVGRPHFPVSPELWEAANRFLEQTMARAKDVGAPLVLHTESATPATFAELAAMADRVGFPRERLVKHYSPPLTLPEESSGLIPSILASRPAIEEALRKGGPFLMETDFLDDPRRPGAVMALTTIPKRTRALLASGKMTEAKASEIHEVLPERLYGIQIEVR